MRYNYEILYTPGKDLIVADALSRSPFPTVPDSEELEAEAEAHVRLIVRELPMKDALLREIIEEQTKDAICSKLKEYMITGWPGKNEIPISLLPYFQYRNEISFSENLLSKGSRIVVLPTLKLKIKES